MDVFRVVGLRIDSLGSGRGTIENLPRLNPEAPRNLESRSSRLRHFHRLWRFDLPRPSPSREASFLFCTMLSHNQNFSTTSKPNRIFHINYVALSIFTPMVLRHSIVAKCYLTRLILQRKQGHDFSVTALIRCS